VSSSKAINRRTANEYANARGKVFSCPVPGCKDDITEAWSIEKFYKHMDVGLHTTYFYQVGIHTCPFGREKGFLNDYALHKHMQKDVCEDGELLFEEIMKCRQCNYSSGRNPDIISALEHLADRHPELMSAAGSPYACAPCGVGFPTEALFWGHLALVRGLSDTHSALMRSLDMAYPAPRIA
jgi:hypothetical protein